MRPNLQLSLGLGLGDSFMFELVLSLVMELIFTMFWTTYAAINTKTAIATATAPEQIEQHLLC